MPSNLNLIRRREMLAGLAGASLLPRGLWAETTEPDPAMLSNYFAARLNPIAARWKAEVAGIQTVDQARARNQFVRAKEHDLLGRWPAKTALKPRVVKTTERDGYRVENVMYQSRPDFWVAANLYVPTRGKGPYPGILASSGHYDDGRFHPDYQLAFRILVENGFVVLAFDPMGQGERRHFWNPETNAPELGSMGRGSGATTEHSLAAHVLEPLGENVNQFFVWDGMRSIDYLLSRPEVDSKRIGAAGHSGGATATMYLSCLDERIQCVVIHEGGLAHQWPIDPAHARLEPADGEQNLFGAATYGMDFVELSAAISPRPLMISIEHLNPNFNAAADDVRKRYKALGAEHRFTTVEANAPHAWTKKLSLANTDWFSRFFYNRPGPTEAPDYPPEPQEVLRCAPNGSLRYSGFGSLFIYTKKQTEELHPSLPPDVPGALRRLMRYKKIEAPMAAHEMGLGHVNINSEDGIVLPAIVVRPTGGGSTAVVYLDDGGAEAARESGLLDRMAQGGRTVVAVDVRGVGQSKLPSTTSRTGTYVQIFDAETWASYSAWQLEDSLVGMRVADTLRTVDYALSLPGVSVVHVAGKGLGALLAMLATATDPRIAGAVCHGGLLSYATMSSAAGTLLGADLILRGVLREFDLPEIAASIANRPLRIVDPVDAMKKPVDIASVRSTYRKTADAYSRKGAAGRFQVLTAGSSSDLAEVYFK